MSDAISPWLPEQNRLRLAILGKLAEEASELSARASRCIIQGLDERDPDSGLLNSEELRREVADVLACIEMLRSRMGLRADEGRLARKFAGFKRWHSMIEGERYLAEAVREALNPDNRG